MKFVLWQWAELFRMVIWEVALANFRKLGFQGMIAGIGIQIFFFFLVIFIY
jgi:hypothetical protein